ncbi:MBG domain-containing protein [Peristeroidobacter agariperforans]|uniref:MBG domain-containing protein n=1 Tax=Peristeroidobacter agariperforans TaxID=268404 RepID=UPI00101DE587|nr:MBG domain-containing protein [Peristeroidobacter agariperforans]
MNTKQGQACPKARVNVLAAPVAIAVSVALILPPQYAYGLPTAGELVAGNVTVTVDGTQMRLDQTSRAAIMNWQQFNIAPNELVRILQNGTDAAMLARVTGGNPSELLGRLQANGKLFLINSKGVIVGPGAMIDTAAFLASTLDVADADFLKQGAFTFKGDSDAGIVNLGKVTAHEGNVVLLAHTVKNAGQLAAPNGAVGLGAGSEVYLASPDAPVFIVKAHLPSAGPGAVGIDNSGVITAAQAQLEAAGGSIYDLAVNHSGVVRASGVERRADGRVLITAAGGNVAMTGTVAARDANGSGGEILVGGDYRGGNAEVANAARTHVAASAVLDASASSTTGDGGRVIVWADNATAFRGALEARAGGQGGDGGFAEVSGKHSLAFDGAVDLSAPAGERGELLLDPDNITIVAGSTTLPDALTEFPHSWFETDDPGDQTLGADSLANLLLNSDVSLYATDTLTVDTPVTVASGGANSVTLTLSASTLAINESVSLANVTDSRLYLSHNVTGPGSSLTSAIDATLTADRIRISGFPIVALNGAVSADQLTYAMMQPGTSFIATHPDNAIGNLTIISDEADPQPVSFSGNVSVHSGSSMSVAALVDSANNVTLSSAGDLTLLGTDGGMPATSISAAGVTRLASTGGVLVNQAGSGLLSGTGRRLLYTSNTAGAFTLGGLSGYAQFDGVGFPDDTQGMVTLVLYNAAGAGPTLTLTITANDFIRLYGQPNPVFTASFSGGTSADLTVQPTFSIQGGPAVNVGTYTIVASGAASNTHNIEYVNGTFRIDPAVLTYVASPARRFYGDSNPLFGGSVIGFVNGDTLASATTGTLTFDSFATAGSDAGVDSIHGSGLSANNGNYIFEQAVTNFSALTIDRAPLTVTVGNATRMYGSANPQFDWAISGFRNEDDFGVLTSFGLFTNATALSSIGAYEISAGGIARNYVLDVVPGTLSITPAPLTLQGSSVSSVFGSAHQLGYTVSGLLNGDTPDVLSGVTFDRAFFNTTAPGDYSFGFSNTGTTLNYEVVATTPGSLTIERQTITAQVSDTRSVWGAAPASYPVMFTPPQFGGPQFTIEAAPDRIPDRPGQYILTPVIKPLGSATLEEIERYYTFDLQPGTLILDAPPLNPVVLKQGAILSAEEVTKQMRDILDQEQSKVEVVYNLGGGNPLTPYDLSRAARDFGPELVALAPGLLASDTVKSFTKDQVELLEQLRDGKLTFAELSHRIENDLAAASAIIPLISQAVFEAVASGKELTMPQQALVARIANRVNEQRRILKEELTNQLRAFNEEKAAIGANNPFALKTMPDIAISAQQAATERALGAAFGAAGGAALGGSVVAALQFTGAVVGHSFATSSTGVLQTTGTVTIGASGATAIIGVAVALVVIGVQSAIMVAQENQNKDAYSTMMSRATTHADAKLAGLDLKNDSLAKAEFLNAFTMAMLETGAK